MNKQIPLDAFMNVQNSGLAYSDLNKFLGSVLEKITFVLGGTFTKAMIPLIELKANNKTIFQTDGSKLDASKLYMGGASDATILTLDLMDRKAVTPNARQAGTLDLSAKSGITQLRLEVTIAGATNPTLAGFADLSPPTEDPAEAGIRWLILRRHRSTQTIGAAGEFALQVPHLDPSGGGSNFRRVHIFSANMTRLKAQREGVTEFDLSKAQIEAAQKDNFRTPQSGLVVFDPVQDGQLQGRTWDTRPSSGVRSAQLYGTFSAGETITIETEELLPLAAY
tara:strand:+ start:499 stop:1338 length:840 start_codon:yes stop_codon:yes gene_type:complete